MVRILNGNKEISVEFVELYSLNCVHQLATGYFGESTRALLMCGLLKYCIDKKKNRIQTVFVSGVFCGLGHALNFFFGNDIVSTLWQVFFTLYGDFLFQQYICFPRILH